MMIYTVDSIIRIRTAAIHALVDICKVGIFVSVADPQTKSFIILYFMYM